MISGDLIGYFTGQTSATGTDCTYLGWTAGATHTDIQGTFVGSRAGSLATTATACSFVGDRAGQVLTTGSSNSFFGSSAGAGGPPNNRNGILSGTGNCLFGNSAGSNYTDAESNNIIIGSALSGTAGESGVVRIGTPGTQTACIIGGISGSTSSGGVGVLVNSSGVLGITTSSIRFKENVQNMDDYSSNILKFRPVTFSYIADETHTIQPGLIAEEVDKIMPNLVAYDINNKIETVKYQELPVLILNEVIKMYNVIEKLKETIEKLQTNACEPLIDKSHKN